MSFNDMTNEQIVARYGGTTWQRIQDRYLVAAGSSSHTVGSTGGSSTVTLTTDNLPSHNHTYSRSSTSTGSHTLTVNEMPSHSHYYDTNATLGVGGRAANSNDNSTYYTNSSRTNSTGGGGSHYHSITRTSVSSGDTGSGTAFSIEPPYIAIYMWRRTA